jgi:hypothetical protein
MGVRSLATAWLALVIAETIGTSASIGFLALDTREFLQTDIIVLTIIIYAVIDVCADGVARFLQKVNGKGNSQQPEFADPGRRVRRSTEKAANDWSRNLSGDQAQRVAIAKALA